MIAYYGTVDKTAWKCLSNPVLNIILAACTVIDVLHRTVLTSSYDFLPRPHLFSFLYPVRAFKEYVLDGLFSEFLLVFVGFRFVDGVEIGAQADHTRAHLHNDRADRSGCSDVQL